MRGRCCILPVLLLCLPAGATAAPIAGRVYLDTNANGAREPGEPGVADVAVSDGIHAVATDESGAYRLEAPDGEVLVRLTVPTDHEATSGVFARVDATRATGNVDFGLRQERQRVPFVVIQVTDIHIAPGPNVARLQAWVDEMNRFAPRPAFIVATGDLVADANPATLENARQQYETYVNAVAGLKPTVHHLPGNHEHVGTRNPQFDQQDPMFGKGMYRHYLGPTHYSRDYGGVHFLMLDMTDINQDGREFNGLPSEEVQWLQADLALVPRDRRIVVFAHQPPSDLRNPDPLAAALRGRNVVGCFVGHLHTTARGTWQGLPFQIGGALCGAWWAGYCPDGSPNGYRIIRVNADGIETFYNAVTRAHQIELEQPTGGDMLSGPVHVRAKVCDAQNELVRGHACLVAGSLRREARARLSPHTPWTVLEADLDTAGLPSGPYTLEVGVSSLRQTWATARSLLVRSEGEAQFTPEADAELVFTAVDIDVPDKVLVGGQQIGVIAAGTTDGTELRYAVPNALLKGLTIVTIEAVPAGPPNYDDLAVENLRLVYRGRTYHDPRFAGRVWIGDNDSGRSITQSFAVFLTAVAPTPQVGPRLSYYWGDLHAHTSHSDGKLKPVDAFTMARDEAKLDFFAVTDHLESLTDEEWADTLAQVDKFHQDGTFVVIPGCEWTKGWGHANIINTRIYRYPATFAEMFPEARRQGAIVFFNHPAWKYAQKHAYDHDNQKYVPAAADIVIGEEVRGPVEREAFILALRNGWHFGAIGTSDTHSDNWGKTGPWTICLAPALTREAIVDALRNRRTFSTTDRNCRPTFAPVTTDDGKRVAFDLSFADPDAGDRMTKVRLYEDGSVRYEYYLNTNALPLQAALAPAEGARFYFAEYHQQDGNYIYSSPVWVPER